MSKRKAHRRPVDGKVKGKRRACRVDKVHFHQPICLECGKKAILVSGAIAYPRQPERARDLFFRCECGAIVSCHPGTAIPTGRPANAETRFARRHAHEHFDKLWQARGGKGSKAALRARENAYRWLAEQLGVPRERAHIGLMDRHTCERVVALCKEALAAR